MSGAGRPGRQVHGQYTDPSSWTPQLVHFLRRHAIDGAERFAHLLRFRFGGDAIAD